MQNQNKQPAPKPVAKSADNTVTKILVALHTLACSLGILIGGFVLLISFSAPGTNSPYFLTNILNSLAIIAISIVGIVIVQIALSQLRRRNYKTWWIVPATTAVQLILWLFATLLI